MLLDILKTTMTRKNNYRIEIMFDIESQSKSLFIGRVPYYGSASYKDDFKIYNDKIIIDANRSAIIPLENVFYNHFSSLYNQVLKSLLFYYAWTRKYTKISSLEISRSRSQKILNKKIFKDKQFNQVLDSSFKLNYQIQQGRLKELFLETPKGRTTLIAISYILSSNSIKNESDRFEKFWKAFNKLFRQITDKKKDFDCLRTLRDFIILNPDILALSLKKVSRLNTDRLRNSIRWRGMLLDDFNTEKKTKSLSEFVLRYSDKRIMEILLETKYGYRETFLKNKGFFSKVDTHIKKHIDANTIKDSEIVLFLTGKYMYYVRNKTFHGEKVDSAFRLSVNKEDKELKFLNSILEPYLIDLINSNDKY